MKLIRKENGDYHLVINDEIKSLQEFNITKDDCDTLTLVYSVEKMAVNSFGHIPTKDDNHILFSLGKGYVGGYQQGFKAHRELVKDKLFTLEQINQAINLAYVSGCNGDTYQDCQKFIEEQLELLPKTEWDIEFDEQDKIKLI